MSLPSPCSADTDTALIRRRCGEASASEECVEVNDGSNNIKLCSCDDKDLCNGAATLSVAGGTCTAGRRFDQV